jgi:hypothetical protein
MFAAPGCSWRSELSEAFDRKTMSPIAPLVAKTNIRYVMEQLSGNAFPSFNMFDCQIF